RRSMGEDPLVLNPGGRWQPAGVPPQNWKRAPNCILRELPRVDVTVPKSSLPHPVDGTAKRGVLVALNISARIWSFMSSWMLNSLERERSKLRMPGPRRLEKNLGALPAMLSPGSSKQSVFRYGSPVFAASVKLIPVRRLSQITFGRWLPSANRGLDI